MIYFLCNQTITVYSAKDYHETVIHGAFMDFNRQWKENDTGMTGQSQCLVVIPQGADGKTFVPEHSFSSLLDTYTISKNDKILLGEGTAITTKEEWSAFIPSKVDGLVVVQKVNPQRGLDGSLAHVEVSA